MPEHCQPAVGYEPERQPAVGYEPERQPAVGYDSQPAMGYEPVQASAPSGQLRAAGPVLAGTRTATFDPAAGRRRLPGRQPVRAGVPAPVGAKCTAAVSAPVSAKCTAAGPPGRGGSVAGPDRADETWCRPPAYAPGGRPRSCRAGWR